MFTDLPFLSVLADDRHRELLADAEQHRLGRLARAARRVRPPSARSRPAPPTDAPPPPAGPSTRREPARDRRAPVPG